MLLKLTKENFEKVLLDMETYTGKKMKLLINKMMAKTQVGFHFDYYVHGYENVEVMERERMLKNVVFDKLLDIR